MHSFGNVRLFIDCHPMRLMVTLVGLSISEYGVLAVLNKNDHIGKNLLEGSSYKLQLELGEELLPQPIVVADLVDKNASQTSLELTFKFHQPQLNMALG